jgi:PAS domain-containing protein
LNSDFSAENNTLKTRVAYLELQLRQRSGELAEMNGKLENEFTEKKRLSEEFSKQEKFYGDVFNSIQDLISILDTDLNIVRTNSAMEQCYKEILPITGKRCYWVYHHHDKPCENCPSLETIRTGKAAYSIIARRDSFGTQTGWEELYTFPWLDSTNGKLRGVIEFVRDITNLRKVEDALAEEKELLSVTMASIGDGVVSTDTSGKIVSSIRLLWLSPAIHSR